MKKGVKAQVSVFIIIAIIIVVVVGIYFFIKGDLKQEIDSHVQPIYSFVESCLKETAENAIVYVSERGGYYNVPELSFNEVPYYLYNGEGYIPTKDEIEEQVSFYVNNNLDSCINEFEDFPDFEIGQDEVESEVKIKDEKVVFKIKYPLKISKGENSYVFEDFETEVFVRLGVVYNAVDNLLLNEIDDPGSVCISCINYFAKENDLIINSMNYDDFILFSVIDEKSKIKNNDLVFSFINKYDFFKEEK